MVASRRGFTLIEVLVVLAIIGTVVLASSPYWVSGPDRRTAIAAQRLLVSFRLARAQAVKLRRVVYLDFAPEPFTPADGVYTAYADLDGNGVADPEEYEASGVVFDAVEAGVPLVRLPRGVSFGPATLEVGPRNTATFPDGVSFSGGVDRAALYPRGTASTGTVYLTARDEALTVLAVRPTIPGLMEAWSWSGHDGVWQRES